MRTMSYLMMLLAILSVKNISTANSTEQKSVHGKNSTKIILHANGSYATDTAELNNCLDSQFQCKVSRKCINRDFVTNGRNNCGTNDTSDEEAPLPRCNSDEFRCRRNGQCIPRAHVNRYIGLCHDKSDSDGIENLPCKKTTEFRCPHGQCIERRYVQSRTEECESNGFDEKVSLTCNDGEFRCPIGGRCIPRHKVRDGWKDCEGGTDEESQSVLDSCGPATGEYQCPGLTKRCIPRWKVGDGIPDCEHWNSPDEELGALNHCLESEHACQGYTTDNTSITLRCIPRSWVNDGVTHCPDASDEHGMALKCTSEEHSCDFETRCLAADKVCDGVADCQDCSDETNTSICDRSDTTKYFLCLNPIGLGETFTSTGVRNSHCILRTYFCDGKYDCADGSDEQQTGVGIKCRISRKRTQEFQQRVCVLPKDLLNDGKIDCDDASDEDGQRIQEEKTACFSRLLTNPSSEESKYAETIFKKQLCDGVFDCGDLSDECLCQKRRGNSPTSSADVCQRICYGLNLGASSETITANFNPCQVCSAGEMLCGQAGVSKGSNETAKCVGIAQICNGVPDCEDGRDEWYCVYQEEKENNTEKEYAEMQCPYPHLTQRYHELPEYAKVCDGKAECLGLVDECDTPEGDSKRKCGLGRKPSYCKIAGQASCDNGSTPLLPYQVCDGISQCVDKIDERHCEDSRFMCDVIGSTVLSDYSADKSIAKGRVSILKEKVCDGYVDCLGAADEKDCPGHFYCRNGESPFFVSRDKMLDGVQDCSDASDECPDPSMFQNDPLSSERELIASVAIRIWLYVVAVPAVLGNFVIIISKIWILKPRHLPYFLSCLEMKCRRTPGTVSALTKCNNIMVLNLAVADLLTGVYLVVLIWKTTKFSGSYCSHGLEWRSSDACEDLGTVVLASSLASLFILTTLTAYRLFAVMRPWKTRNLRPVWATCFTSSAWVTAVIFALIPRLQIVKEAMVTKLWLSSDDAQHSFYFPHDAVSRADVETFVRKACVLKNITTTGADSACHGIDKVSSNWQLLSSMLAEILPSSKIKGEFGFYSAHGVCLPSLLEQSPTASGFSYSLLVTTVIFFACLFIVVAYALVAWRAGGHESDLHKTDHGRSRSSSSEVTLTTTIGLNSLNVNLARVHVVKPATKTQTDNRVSNMNRKIARIVLTNCLCWVPLCIVAYIGQAGFAIPPWLYAFFAVVLLPVNSALNPLIYSDVLQKSMAQFWKKMGRRKRATSAIKASKADESYNNNGGIASNITPEQLNAVKETKGPSVGSRPTSIAPQSNKADETVSHETDGSSDRKERSRSRWSRFSRLLGSTSSCEQKYSSSSKHDEASSDNMLTNDWHDCVGMKTLTTVVAATSPDEDQSRVVAVNSVEPP